jgi:hypothetical protein
MHDVQRQLHAEGYAIVRGFFDADEMKQIGLETDRIYQEGLKHHTTFRHKNLLLELLEDPKARRRVVIRPTGPLGSVPSGRYRLIAGNARMRTWYFGTVSLIGSHGLGPHARAFRIIGSLE